MARYHVNDQGEPGPCRAKTRPCPFGSEEEHYASPELAREAFEDEMRREELFQKCRRALDSEGVLPLPYKRALRLTIMELQGEASLPRSKRESLNALERLLERHEAAREQERQAYIASIPPEPVRVGNLYLEEKEDYGQPFTAVTDLSRRDVGSIVVENGAYVAKAKGYEPLGSYAFREDALAALETYNAAQYKMSHQPDPEGVPGYDVELYYPDYYARPSLYRHDPACDRETYSALKAMRADPEAEVTIYRSLPDSSYGIQEGNWVTLSKTYAQQHGIQHDGTQWPVIELKVRAKDIRSPGDSVQEWGYYPAAQ